jgi:hypothetical protein
MLALKGIYDGKNVRLFEPLTDNKKYKVVVTFIEEINDEAQELRTFASGVKDFTFWESEKEDLYQDYLKPKS